MEVYTSWIDAVISNYNTDFYYQSREYIYTCYIEGKSAHKLCIGTHNQDTKNNSKTEGNTRLCASFGFLFLEKAYAQKTRYRRCKKSGPEAFKQAPGLRHNVPPFKRGYLLMMLQLWMTSNADLRFISARRFMFRLAQHKSPRIHIVWRESRRKCLWTSASFSKKKTGVPTRRDSKTQIVRGSRNVPACGALHFYFLSNPPSPKGGAQAPLYIIRGNPPFELSSVLLFATYIFHEKEFPR